MPFFFLSVLLCLVIHVEANAAPAHRNHKPRVVLTEFSAPPKDVVAARLASSITNSVELVLRLTGTVSIRRADFLAPNRTYRRAVDFYESDHADVAVFGKVETAAAGGYVVNVRIWSANRTGSNPIVLKRKISNVLSVFSFADRLALDVGSKVVGKKLQFGTLLVRGVSGLKNFGVYADGQLLGRRARRYRVLSGKRTVIVATPGPLGDQPLETFHVDVPPRGSVTVTVKRPAKKAVAASSGAGGPAARPPTLAKKAAALQAGSLSVSSRPAGATVYLNAKVLGTTPLHLVGVPAGKYDLTLKRAYFLPARQAVQVKGGGTVEKTVRMRVDATDPAVKKHLISPAGATLTASVWTLLQASWLIAPPLLFASTGFSSSLEESLLGVSIPGAVGLATDAAYLRVGHRYARDPLGTHILDIGGAVAGSLFVGWGLASDLGLVSSSSAISTTVVPFTLIGTTVASIVYDLAFAATAAQGANRRTLALIQRTGKLPATVRYPPHPWILETGGGSVLRFGYRFRLIPRYLSLAATAGVAVSSLSPLQAYGSGVVRLVATPFGDSTGRLRPVVYAVGEGASDIAQNGFSVGGGIGADLHFRSFVLFTRSGYRYGLVTGNAEQTFTLGGRF